MEGFPSKLLGTPKGRQRVVVPSDMGPGYRIREPSEQEKAQMRTKRGP